MLPKLGLFDNYETMDIHALQYKQRKQHLREFNKKAKMVLSQKERDYLYGSLKEYQAYRQVHAAL